MGMALAGHTFALSAGGSWITQRELGELIKLHGGQLSKIVHKRVLHVPSRGHLLHPPEAHPLLLRRSIFLLRLRKLLGGTRRCICRTLTIYMCPTLPQLQPTVVQAVRKAVKFGIRLVLPDFLVASVKAGAPVDPEVHRNGLQVGARRIARSADPAALHITILLRRFLLHYGLEETAGAFASDCSLLSRIGSFLRSRGFERARACLLAESCVERGAGQQRHRSSARPAEGRAQAAPEEPSRGACRPLSPPLGDVRGAVRPSARARARRRRRMAVVLDEEPLDVVSVVYDGSGREKDPGKVDPFVAHVERVVTASDAESGATSARRKARKVVRANRCRLIR